MNDATEQKKMGRPPLPPEKKRTGRLSMRTYCDVEAKAKRVGTEAVEQAIRNIRETDDEKENGMASQAYLKDLEKRLLGINGPECVLACEKVGRVCTFFGITEDISGDEEHDLFREVWDEVTRALDHGNLSEKDKIKLEAIEAEMAGHVLTHLVQKGLLVSAPAKEDPPRRTRFQTLLGHFSLGNRGRA